jgi:hypothetical protein
MAWTDAARAKAAETRRRNKQGEQSRAKKWNDEVAKFQAKLARNSAQNAKNDSLAAARAKALKATAQSNGITVAQQNAKYAASRAAALPAQMKAAKEHLAYANRLAGFGPNSNRAYEQGLANAKISALKSQMVNNTKRK